MLRTEKRCIYALTLGKRQLLVLLALLTLFGSCSRENVELCLGQVVKIVDGDTITILDARNVQHKIRLQGIDAPERRQDFSEVSREHLAGLVFGKQVRVEYEKVDKWGRLIGKVWIDGNDECREQLKAGLAWHYKEYEREAARINNYLNPEHGDRASKIDKWAHRVGTVRLPSGATASIRYE